jgi:transposase
MCGFLIYHPDGRSARLAVHHTTGTYHDTKLITTLRRLRHRIGAAPAILVWDGLSAHRSTTMKRFLHTQRRWLTVIALPGYAPDLNPVENLWSALKNRDLANRAFDNLTDLWQAATTGINRIRRRRPLLWSFLATTGLTHPSTQ